MPPFQRKTLVLIGAQGVGRRSLKNRFIVLNPTRFGTTVPCKFFCEVFFVFWLFNWQESEVGADDYYFYSQKSFYYVSENEQVEDTEKISDCSCLEIVLLPCWLAA